MNLGRTGQSCYLVLGPQVGAFREGPRGQKPRTQERPIFTDSLFDTRNWDSDMIWGLRALWVSSADFLVLLDAVLSWTVHREHRALQLLFSINVQT